MQHANLKFLRNSVILFLLIWCIHQLFILFPALYEILYLDGLFKIIRILYDYALGYWLPIPMVVIVFLILLLYLFYPHKSERTFISVVIRLVSKIFVVLSFFYIFWGWNYAQKPLSTSLGLEASLKPDSVRLMQEAFWAQATINSLRSELSEDTISLSLKDFKKNIVEKEIRNELRSTLSSMNLASTGRPRIRALRPKGALLRFKTAGIYVPYAFEGHIDAGMMKIEWPYTIAHEMSHGFGVTDEGACNFIAFIACMDSENTIFQYSAMIDYTLYVLRDVYRLDKALHRKVYNKLSGGVKADIQAIRDNNDKYPDILPDIRDYLYDTYLKSHGVSAGLKSYSQLTGLVIQYKENKGWNLIE